MIETKDEQRFYVICKGVMDSGLEVDREYGPLTKMKAQDYIQLLETFDVNGKYLYNGITFTLVEK